MKHVAAHRWAEVHAGRMDGPERLAVEEHARGCARCADQRDRVLAARAAFPTIAESEPAELRWDHIGARIYWVTSSERRAAERHRHRRPSWRSVWVAAAAACSLAVAGLAIARLLADSTPPRQVTAIAPRTVPAATDIMPVELTPEPIFGVVTFVQGEVALSGAPLELDGPVRAGDALVTTAGRVTVQFGADSAFELGPSTTLAVARLDSDAIELEVSGLLDVDIAIRPDRQRFVVIAGSNRVIVRGTAFRVDHRGGNLEVSCARGNVVVVSGVNELTVGAGERLLITLAEAARRAVEELPSEELQKLERSISMPMLPVWNEPAALFATSSTLSVQAEAGHAVTVDGVNVGEGAFHIRVMSGRHQVDDTWVDLAAGASAEAKVAADAEPTADSVAPSADRRARRRQLERALGRSPRLRQCVRPLAKLELLEGSFVEFDVGVNEDGTQGHLNVVRSNVPPDVERCLRAVIDGVAFPAGARVDLRYRLAF